MTHPRAGILKDYDLMANAEPSAKAQRCVTCGADPVCYQWSDLSGEGMCTACGTPYQLKWGSDVQEIEARSGNGLLDVSWQNDGRLAAWLAGVL